jgi:hypothetical protein
VGHESNLQWVTVNGNNPSAAPVPVANPAVSGALMLVNSNAAKTCPADKSSPVNIVDSYPGVTLTGNIIDSCLCYSQYSGETCQTFTTATNCPNATVVAMTANTGQQVRSA